MLRHHGVKPILVFDGGHLPMKSEQENKRARNTEDLSPSRTPPDLSLIIIAVFVLNAQMTFLAVSKLVDAVITEDSDLIPFGCPRIIYKMDKFGQGVEFQSSRLQQNKELNLTDFTKQMFLEMCILSGCDYLQSLPGMGLKKAHALIKKFKSYDKVIKHLKYSNVAVPPMYEEFFRKALLTFQYQRVYDPIKEDIVYLSDISDSDGDDKDFLGPYP
ncbi:hypothetical protein AgCh_015419 [Apium graveolens]